MAVGAPIARAGTQAWHRSTALPRCSAPRTRRGRACDGSAFRHAGQWCGPTTAVERLTHLPFRPTPPLPRRPAPRLSPRSSPARQGSCARAHEWSPKRSTAPPQPWGGPQVLLCKDRGCRRRRGPSWDRKSAGELGGMSGSSVHSRTCVFRIRVARICHPCGQSPHRPPEAGAPLPTGRATWGRSASPPLAVALVPPHRFVPTRGVTLLRLPRPPGTGARSRVASRAARLPTPPSKLPGLSAVC